MPIAVMPTRHSKRYAEGPVPADAKLTATGTIQMVITSRGRLEIHVPRFSPMPHTPSK